MTNQQEQLEALQAWQNGSHLDEVVKRLTKDGREAEALSLRFADKFCPYKGEVDWDDVTLWLYANRPVIENRPDQFVRHLGMNDFRTSVFILMHRMGFLSESADPDELRDAALWLLDGSHHTVSVYHDDWVDIIEMLGTPLFDSEYAKGVYRGLPDIVTIYRGYCGETGRQDGICWTLDREQAAKFARTGTGFASRHADPRLATAEVDKEDIAGVLMGREEQILITSPGFLHIASDEEVTND